MNKRSKRTLQRVQENDPTLTELHIGIRGLYEEVTVSNFSKLGNALGKNKYVTKIAISIDGLKLKSDDYRNSGFSNGLKQNSLINELCLLCNSGIFTGAGFHPSPAACEIMKVYETKNNLTILRLRGFLGGGGGYGYEGHQIVANTLRGCTNLKVMELIHTGITDKQLTPIVGAVRWISALEEELNLSHNRIGNVGCKIFAALLRLPTCNIHTLNIEHNHVSNEGLSAIANELVNNIKLKRLHVDRTAIDQNVTAAFSRLSFDASTSVTGMGQVVFSRISSDSTANYLVLERINII